MFHTSSDIKRVETKQTKDIGEHFQQQTVQVTKVIVKMSVSMDAGLPFGPYNPSCKVLNGRPAHILLFHTESRLKFFSETVVMLLKKAEIQAENKVHSMNEYDRHTVNNFLSAKMVALLRKFK